MNTYFLLFLFEALIEIRVYSYPLWCLSCLDTPSPPPNMRYVMSPAAGKALRYEEMRTFNINSWSKHIDNEGCRILRCHECHPQRHASFENSIDVRSSCVTRVQAQLPSDRHHRLSWHTAVGYAHIHTYGSLFILLIAGPRSSVTQY